MKIRFWKNRISMGEGYAPHLNGGSEIGLTLTVRKKNVEKKLKIIHLEKI